MLNWTYIGIGAAIVTGVIVGKKMMQNPNSVDTFESHVCPHGPITQLASNLYQVSGSMKRGPLRNMQIYVMKSGGLLITSCIAMDESHMKKMEALGVPSILVVPNSMHRLDAAVYKARYPSIKVFCPEGVKQAVEKVVPVDGTLEDNLATLKQNGVEVTSTPGVKCGERALIVETAPGETALLVTDLLFNMPSNSGAIAWLMRSSGYFGVTPLGKMMLVVDKKKLADYLTELSQKANLKVICVAHGDAVTSGVSEKLQAAAARLK